jgi:hypothetical protein
MNDITDEAEKMLEGVTEGPWRREAMGGSSSVIAATEPARNDSRVPAYAYDPAQGYCLAYPFTEDDGLVRLDFVRFSHEDARFIAWSRTGVPALIAENKRLREALGVYADQLCEGLCREYGPNFDDDVCFGCQAKKLLASTEGGTDAA